MGRTHACKVYWSPLTFAVCPGCDTDADSEYDLNHELGGSTSGGEGG
jgi:hypothetical protein